MEYPYRRDFDRHRNRFYHQGSFVTYIDILFDAPPGPTSGRFIEVEDESGKSIQVGEWIERADGYWALRIPRAQIDSRPSFEREPPHCKTCDCLREVDEDVTEYPLDYALHLARLWRAGKMIGGDQDAVIQALLIEVERLACPASK